MGYWKKHFTDGLTIIGTDKEIALGHASWSKSRLSNLICVELENNGHLIRLYGLGEFWQADMYESVFPGPNTTLVKRVIERKINPQDVCFAIMTTEQSMNVSFNQQNKVKGTTLILEDWHNKWFILELDVQTSSMRWYIRDNRL